MSRVVHKKCGLVNEVEVEKKTERRDAYQKSYMVGLEQRRSYENRFDVPLIGGELMDGRGRRTGAKVAGPVAPS